MFAQERATIALAVTAALLATGFNLWMQNFTSTLAFGTLHGAATLLNLFYEPLVLDVASRIIGTGNFVVRVSNDCAGYEGIALIVVFLTIYLWLFRSEFRFPRALLAFPIGFAIIWIFNVFRVTVLISIGDSVSLAVALTGFHSNAGWIAFLVVSMGLIGLLHKIPFFTTSATHTTDSGKRIPDKPQSRVVDALMIPFVVLLASILLLGALSADFDQLYPAKVLVAGFALWHFRHVYNFSKYQINFEAMAIGVLVFIVWILLVPASTEQTGIYNTQLSQWPATTVFIWVTFRVVGSVVTVPLVEELAFRGYLLPRLAGKLPAINSPLQLMSCRFNSGRIGDKGN